uniref:Uncharacterized protein n=1 Tax=Glossina austeni TaxID=7395 RepID=A0A1A9V6B5_GLOAU
MEQLHFMTSSKITIISRNLHLPNDHLNTKAKPPSGNIPCATPENPISSAPSIIVSRVQPEVGTCGKAASSILIRIAFALASFESSEDSLIRTPVCLRKRREFPNFLIALTSTRPVLTLFVEEAVHRCTLIREPSTNLIRIQTLDYKLENFLFRLYILRFFYSYSSSSFSHINIGFRNKRQTEPQITMCLLLLELLANVNKTTTNSTLPQFITCVPTTYIPRAFDRNVNSIHDNYHIIWFDVSVKI